MKIVMIGPTPPPLGGATVLFQQLVDGMKVMAPHVEVEVLSTARPKISRIESLLAALRIMRRLPQAVRSSEVVAFHASRKGALLFAPVLVALCRFYGKPWIFRGFGGYFAGWYEALPALPKWLARKTLFAADALLVETKASVDFFSALVGSRVFWYANSRSLGARGAGPDARSARARRFVYVGQVYAGKGLPELLAASSRLDPEITVDVYGPFREGMSAQSFAGSRVRYCGVLSPEQVLEVLRQYDVMVLPTRLQTEGYPGAILEAFTVGLPVIASRVGAIAEIVDARCGVLIAPGNVDELAGAINAIAADRERFAQLRAGAWAAVEQFSSNHWTSRFVEIASGLACARRAT